MTVRLTRTLRFARQTDAALTSDGLIYAERIAGLEHWIDAGLVTVNYMDFKDTKSASSFHQQFIDHCSSNYAKSTNFLAHLDIDEFLHMTPPLYGHPSPYRDDERAPPSAAKVVSTMPWRYPLHDLLARPATAEAACVPVPQLKYRNLGVRKLGKGESVLETQTRRNAIKHGNSPEKVGLALR